MLLQLVIWLYNQFGFDFRDVSKWTRKGDVDSRKKSRWTEKKGKLPRKDINIFEKSLVSNKTCCTCSCIILQPVAAQTCTCVKFKQGYTSYIAMAHFYLRGHW